MRKSWWQREALQGQPLEIRVTSHVLRPEETDNFYDGLRNLPGPDLDLEILVPIIIYPINGRADCVNPTAHFYWASQRELAIQHVMAEVKQNEGREDTDRFATLLRDHDTVRIGRIVVHMYRLKQGAVQLPGPPWLKTGVEVLE